MYVNLLITLQENASTYGANGKSLSGHITMRSPGRIMCYVQNLRQSTGEGSYGLYAFSKANNKGVRVGTLTGERETKWLVDEKNVCGSGLKLDELDGVAVVAENFLRQGTEMVLSGFKESRFMIIPLIEEIFNQIMVPKQVPPRPQEPEQMPPPRPQEPEQMPPPRPQEPEQMPPPRPQGPRPVMPPPPRPQGPGPVMPPPPRPQEPEQMPPPRPQGPEQMPPPRPQGPGPGPVMPPPPRPQGPGQMPPPRPSQGPGPGPVMPLPPRPRQSAVVLQPDEINGGNNLGPLEGPGPVINEGNDQKQYNEEPGTVVNNKNNGEQYIEGPEPIIVPEDDKQQNDGKSVPIIKFDQETENFNDGQTIGMVKKIKILEQETNIEKELAILKQSASGVPEAPVVRSSGADEALMQIIAKLKTDEKVQEKARSIEEQIERMSVLPQSHKLFGKSSVEETAERRFVERQNESDMGFYEEEQEEEFDQSPRAAHEYLARVSEDETREITALENTKVYEKDAVDYVNEIDKKIKEIEAKRRQEIMDHI